MSSFRSWPALFILILGFLVASCGGSDAEGDNGTTGPDVTDPNGSGGSGGSGGDGGAGDFESYSVSGRILDINGEPVPAVLISFGDAAVSVATDGEGKWSRDGLEGEVTVTPEKEGYVFEPKSREVTGAAADVDFRAHSTFSASGSVKDEDGDPIPGAVIRLTVAGSTEEVTTDEEGMWNRSGLHGSVTAVAVDAAYSFSPEMHTFDAGRTDFDFVGTMKDCNEGDANDMTNPCVLTRIKQVQGIRHKLDGHYALGADINASATKGWNDNEGFEPIGSEDHPFTGSLDGRNFEIIGLYIDRPTESEVGLIGFLEGAVRNLGLADGYVHGYSMVGTLAGRNLENGTVANSYNAGKVGGTVSIGGLIGMNSGTVENSYNLGALTATANTLGGVVGYNFRGTVLSSYNLGELKGTGNVGGVAGSNDVATIENSYNFGELSGTHNVGGVAGFNASATVQNSYNVGKVTGDRDVGGVVGLSNRTVTSCYFNAAQSPDNGYGEGKAESELKQQATFTGWDYTDIWMIDEDNDYPDLRNNPR